MASNAAVEKLKALGIRHGEKAVLALTATALVVCAAVALFVKTSTVDVTSEQLSNSADQAKKNLATKQPLEKILEKLDKDGIKEPHLEKVIDNQIANALKPGNYRAKLDWVTPEPGAGLIRDQPELIAPTELAAFPGRGGIYMYKLNDKGEREVETPEEAAKKKQASGGRKNSGGNVPGMPGLGGGASGTPKDEKPEEKKKREAEEAKRKAAFTEVEPPKDKEKAKDAEAAAPPEGTFKEETKGKRWVVLTAVIDNAKLRSNYLMALKNEAIAYPNYVAVGIERQTRQSDGEWSEWGKLDQDKNYEVLDNLPELDTEFVPESQRPSALCDPLPFLKAGYWTGVHVGRLVPDEIRNPTKGPSGGAPGSGKMGMGPGGVPGEMGGGPPSRQGGAGNKFQGMGMGGPPGMGGPGMGKGGGGEGDLGADETSFTKLDAPTLMIRRLDFTVEPDTTYRFRIRIIVANPNLNHTDVNPGVDVDSAQLQGPWSEPSEAISVPADVAAYAQAPEPAPRRDDLVAFQVIRWDPVTGHTVVKNDIAGPGEFVGEYGSIQMPSSEGKGAKSTPIDFNSRSIVLDTLGGRQKLPEIGVERNDFEIPAMAMIIEPDGMLVIRSQSRDKADEVRKDMDTNYKLAVEESNKAREKGKSKSGMGGKRGRKGGGKKMGGASRGGGNSRQSM